MADEPPNPYAPPIVQDAPDLQKGLWKCDGTDLWVRTGAFLPGVDLLTGEVLPADAVVRQVSLMPLNLRVLIPCIFIAGAASGREQLESWLGFHIPIEVLTGIVVLLCLLSGRWLKVPTWLIRYQQSQLASRRLMRPILIWIACIIGSCVVGTLIAWALVSQSTHRMEPFAVGGLILVPPVVAAIVGGVLVLKRDGQLRTGGTSGDWLLLRGVHQAAIDFLCALPPPPDPASRPNLDLRTYVIHMAKHPLLEWFRLLRWRPLPCLNILLTKLLQPRALDTRAVMQTKPSTAGSEVVSTEFRDRILAMEPGLREDGWSIHTWIHLPIPDRFNSHSEQICLFHRDRRDLMFFSRVRGDAFPERYSVALYAWLPDGTSLKTSDDTAFASAIPMGCEWEQLPGTPSPELIARHMRKSVERGAVSLRDAGEAFERVIRMNLENHARLHARGICGPLEEISA
ncbi:hypothetical protein KBB96_15520 [Luteolibacter ambystomatis]|uniref:Uncharacterized protein n=1 Tax=Luteolibacter ambystomatis TaxID=2824561 RepID=A0A975G7K6_9BACT|nr:hypothetical protein [Luteolibacter ambystomatis]QUE50272.1 hypothetical protein KBB96_15520 [Luteolibacter ambystomatis]